MSRFGGVGAQAFFAFRKGEPTSYMDHAEIIIGKLEAAKSVGERVTKRARKAFLSR